MSTEFKGYVASIASKSLPSKKKAGQTFNVYSFEIEDQSGELTKVDFGYDSPPFKEGDFIAFTATENGPYLKYDKNSGKIVKSPPFPRAAKAPAPAPVEGTAPARRNSGYEDPERQRQIITQHSQEIAVRLLEMLLANNAFPMSAAKTKAGEAQRYDELLHAFRKLTAELVEDVVTTRVRDTYPVSPLAQTKADGQIPAPAPTPEPKKEEAFE